MQLTYSATVIWSSPLENQYMQIQQWAVSRKLMTEDGKLTPIATITTTVRRIVCSHNLIVYSDSVDTRASQVMAFPYNLTNWRNHLNEENVTLKCGLASVTV
ncbi:unnamed protein product [Dicrocoelium dendriticum]|nr:unnamed protein product [Dicrocoelium dendriticum]